MALTFLGISVRDNGTGPLVTVPPGITNVILDPEPAFDFDNPNSYEYARVFVERVTNVIASGSTDDAVNFDAIFDLIENEVVTQAANFNSTSKNVEIWGRIEGIGIVPNSLYQRPSGMQIDYNVGVSIYVTVT